jgi:hypothetical protein
MCGAIVDIFESSYSTCTSMHGVGVGKIPVQIVGLQGIRTPSGFFGMLNPVRSWVALRVRPQS